LLSDEADWSAESWSLRTEVLERVATALEIVASQGPRGVVIAVSWAGEMATRTVRITPAELAALVRANGLGTRVRYVVVHEGAG
jgi:hypothetical protein